MAATVNPVIQIAYADRSRAAVDAALNPGECGINEGTELEAIFRKKIALSGSIHFLSEERCQANPSGVQTLMGGPFAPYELPYAEGITNITFKGLGGAAAGPFACPFVRKGKIVCLSLPQTSGTFNHYSTYTGVITLSGIDASLLPATDLKVINVPAVMLTVSASQGECPGKIVFSKSLGLFFLNPMVTTILSTNFFTDGDTGVGLAYPTDIVYSLY